jgi:2',3'-cyclic-nucleotide 2'-phosphodiesterase (5'-nucleotidase family)
VPTFEPLDDDKVYGIITTAFVADGGDGFRVIQDNASDKLILGQF